MSCSYAEGLSEYHDKGKLGLPEKFDLEDEIRDKVETLTQWIREARHIVVHRWVWRKVHNTHSL